MRVIQSGSALWTANHSRQNEYSLINYVSVIVLFITEESEVNKEDDWEEIDESKIGQPNNVVRSLL